MKNECKKNNFLLLKKLKYTESAQLCECSSRQFARLHAPYSVGHNVQHVATAIILSPVIEG